MNKLPLIKELGYAINIKNNIILSNLSKVVIGEICEIYENLYSNVILARGQVTGYDNSGAWINVIGSTSGFSNDIIIKPTGKLLSIIVRNCFLGAVLDANGNIIERISSAEVGTDSQEMLIDNPPPTYLERKPITNSLETGIRVIDGLLTCGIGQRMGIFASAGCGKTVLMHMLIEHTDADVFVVALIGERGREVTECAEELKKSDKASQCVLVYATSDFSAVDRSNAAYLATTIAEYFRDQGKKVVLFMDSLTRFARALRDVKLAAGELPARRGYPSSVFDSLPKLLERPGNTMHGSITAFYTILLEGEDDSDPLGDEIRSLIDGHIYLSRKLAGKGHYPAVDVLNSVSRVFGQVNNSEHKKIAYEIRNLLATLNSLQIMIDLGEYKPGVNVQNDKAVNSQNKINNFLIQDTKAKTFFEDTYQRMKEIAGYLT